MREYALRLGIDLGSTLSRSEAAILAAVGTEKQFDRGCILHRQDEPAGSLHLLLSGMVKTFQNHPGGQESVLRIHLAGSLIGLSSLTTRGLWDATSITLKASRAIMITKPNFLRLLEDNPGLSIKLVRLLVDRLSDLHFRIGELQTQTVEQRLAYALLSLSRPDPMAADLSQRPGISLTHEELAQLINTRRQTVTSILKRFAASGLIVRSSRSIEVAAPKRLERLLHEAL